MHVIDWTLNPENCEDKGLSWITDTYYHPEPDMPDSIEHDFDELIESGYRLGEPANRNMIQNGFVGLYKPLS